PRGRWFRCKLLRKLDFLFFRRRNRAILFSRRRAIDKRLPCTKNSRRQTWRVPLLREHWWNQAMRSYSAREKKSGTGKNLRYTIYDLRVAGYSRGNRKSQIVNSQRQFFEQFHSGFDKRFTRAGLDARIRDFVTAFGERFFCRHITGPVIRNGNHNCLFERRLF